MTDFDDNTLSQLATKVSQTLREHGHKLATAESCTGGWIAKVMTDQAGSSDVFTDGFVTYSNAAKNARLGVLPALFDSDGAVSAAVVRAMAIGAMAASGSQRAVAVSGIAGPGGGSPEKPVGTVWIGWAHADGGTRAQCFLFDGDREQIRRATVAAALQGVFDAA
ncbi:MAG: CinA family protein [Gammaproteobacteria bacterium]